MTRTRTEDFDQLAWPAAAGNVAWSVLTLCLDNSRPSDWPGRLILLVALAIYLSVDWVRRPSDLGNPWVAVASSLHLAALAVLAIAAAVKQDAAFLAVVLAVFLVVTVVAHVWSAWESSKVRFYLAGANALGLAILGLACWCDVLPGALWPVPVAATAVLIAWGIARDCDLGVKGSVA